MTSNKCKCKRNNRRISEMESQKKRRRIFASSHRRCCISLEKSIPENSMDERCKVTVPSSTRSMTDCAKEAARDFETEISVVLADDNFSKQATPIRFLLNATEDLESTMRRQRSPAVSIPSAAEIEEFFAEAEKYEAKRFAEKYNYDIVKDVPLEGRYHWVASKP